MTSPDLATFVTGYFVRHLAAERNVSAHTTAAYRDTLKLLLRFARAERHNHQRSTEDGCRTAISPGRYGTPMRCCTASRLR